MDGTPDRLTIDELARAAGTKVSTIRLYQQKGLLPPPAIVGRVGFYDAGHVARLRLVADLRERGFSLAAIRELADTWATGRDLGALLGIERALGDTVARRRVTRAELAQHFPTLADEPALLERVERLGAAVPVGDDAYDVDPGFLGIGTTMHAIGVPLAVLIDEFEAVDAFARAAAARYVEQFERHVWEPSLAAGDADLQQVAAAIGALREAAVAVVGGAMRKAIDDAAADAVARHAAHLAGGSVAPPGDDPLG